MNTRCLSAIATCCVACFVAANGAGGAAPPPPAITNITVNNFRKSIQWTPYPHAERYTVLAGNDLAAGLAPAQNGTISGFSWTVANGFRSEFYQVAVQPMSSNALLTAQVLNRLAYGPTPDELERILTGTNAIGPEAYIQEQLQFEAFPPEPMDQFSTVATNGVPPDAQPATNWINVRVEGEVSSTRLYLYLTAIGDAYIDNVALYAGAGETVDETTNYVQNGDFESAWPGPWNVEANHANSALSPDLKYDGNAALHLVATSPGTTRTSSIWQDLAPGLTIGEPCTLSYWYRPATNASILTVRLSGRGVDASPTNETTVIPEWVYATQTGTATSTKLYVYLDGAGQALIDDLQLVAGTEPEGGPNLLVNGDFESPLATPWDNSAEVSSNSFINHRYSHSGLGSLNLVFSGRGSSDPTAVVQRDLPLTLGQPYTLSYWYVPSPNNRLTVRLSGSGIRSEPDTGTGAIFRRLNTTPEGASLADLRAWFIQHAVGARNQLMEVLLQFLENHFVTQHGKTLDYLDRFYDDFNLLDRLAANLEYREISRWRQALLNPQCTFYDLLKVHAESPAEIIYLDTVDSRGDGDNIANENYGRELLELFTFGVDNGYTQSDIVELSKAWTGWRVDIVDAANIDNPFAPRSTTLRYPGSNSRSNLVGVWTFNYQERYHNNQTKFVFPGKVVPARFGAPWAGRLYQLTLHTRTGAAGLQDGYDVLAHLANQPFTEEFISVKLCRLFVHDDFVHGVYDYSDEANLSPEGKLVKQCMLAWENSEPKGQIRLVLQTIFNSELFRTGQGALHKVKTPLEFAVSAIRALRGEKPDGSFTADTDGYSITGRSRTPSSAPLTRMGTMLLFDRADPDGYPEAGPPWISAGTLAERLRFVQTALIADGAANKNDGISGGNHNRTDPVALLKLKLPAASWNDARAVADFFLSLLYPAEGRANLDLYGNSAVAFLNTGDDGVSSSPFSSLADGSEAYDTRVRGMVAMLLTFQRFQEQ